MITTKRIEDRQQWLNSLKVGDEIFVCNNFHAEICRITKITPTRRFEVNVFKSTVFNNAGHQMGDTWNALVLYPVTEKEREQVARNKALKYIDKFKFSSLTTKQLLEVLKLIHEDIKQEE